MDLAAADAYAAGVTLFRLATGERPTDVKDVPWDRVKRLTKWTRALLNAVRMPWALRRQCSVRFHLNHVCSTISWEPSLGVDATPVPHSRLQL